MHSPTGNDPAVANEGFNRRKATGNSLFRNILPASHLFAIFCGLRGISGPCKCPRIN